MVSAHSDSDLDGISLEEVSTTYVAALIRALILCVTLSQASCHLYGQLPLPERKAVIKQKVFIVAFAFIQCSFEFLLLLRLSFMSFLPFFTGLVSKLPSSGCEFSLAG